MLGRVLSRYRLEEEIGQGGMAVVYRGHDQALQRAVAVKILHPHLQNRQESKIRFHREAQAVARLSHPNILEIYDYSGTDSPESFIVTEFIRGLTLRAFVDRHGIPFPEIGVMITCEIASALDHAHNLGIIHRDVKPENVMIRDDGVVKLTDFGIAQMVDAQTMTATGALIGSPAHMAPEVIDGKGLDARSDIFSLGTVLYWMAVGELPFSGATASALLKKIAEGIYADPQRRNGQISDRLARVIAKSLAHDAADRYQKVASLRSDLMDVLAEVEVESPTGELKGYFADPGAYTQRFAKRVVTTLRRRGDEARRKGQVAKALAYYDRVLAIEPANPSVVAALRRVSEAKRWWKAAIAVSATAVGITAAAIITAVTIGNSSPDNPAPDSASTARPTAASGPASRVPATTATAISASTSRPATSRAAVPDGASAATSGPTSTQGASAASTVGASTATSPASQRGDGRADGTPREDSEPQAGPRLAHVLTGSETPAIPHGTSATRGRRDVAARPRATEARRDATVARAVVARENARQVVMSQPDARILSLHVYPLASKIYVDGQWKGHGDAKVPLPPGRYHVQFVNPSTERFESWVTIPESGVVPEIRRTLPWLPARLTVHSNVEAELWVDGVRKGTTAESERSPARIQIADGPYDSPRRVVEVRLVSGRSEAKKRLPLTAGNLTETTLFVR